MDLHVRLEGRGDLAGQIYRQIRASVLDGRLRDGERLPPTRELARRLRVSRTTVSVAYDRLTGEGVIEARTGSGTFVRKGAGAGGGARPTPDTAGQGRAPDAARALRPLAVWDDIALPVTSGLGADGRPGGGPPRVRSRPASAAPSPPPSLSEDAWERYAGGFDEPPFDFRPGIPDLDLFPFETWRRRTAAELRAASTRSAMYGDPAGHRGLREAIARHVAVARGVAGDPEDIVVTAGAQQAMDLVGRVLLRPGDAVAVENPGYPPFRSLFTAQGARVVPVPVDEGGLVVDALPADARLVCVAPSHQFPLGMPMAPDRRAALLAWAERTGAAVVEDDYDSEFRFTGRPLETLASLDVSGRVIYVGTFSKTLLPTLRQGFLIAPPSLRRAFRAAKYVSDFHTALPTQAVLARFIDDGSFARHVRRVRTAYRSRRARIIGALSREGGALVPIPSEAGVHLSALAPAAGPRVVRAATRYAAGSGVSVYPLSYFHAGRGSPAGVVLGYGAIPLAAVDEGIRRLGSALGRAGGEAERGCG